VFKKGVYSENKQLTFNVCTKFQGNSSIKEHSNKYKKDFQSDSFHSIIIDAVKLDSENLGHIDFLKIDTEGGEYHVFLGMKDILDKKEVDTIVFELNKSMLQEDTDNFLNFLKQYEGAYNYNFLQPNGELVRANIEDIFKHDFLENIVMRKV
jgi:hypothetical protein